MTDIYQSTDNSAYSFASCKYFCNNCNRQFSQIKVDQSATTARCPRCNLYAEEITGPQVQRPTQQRQQQQQTQQPRQNTYTQGSSYNTQNTNTNTNTNRSSNPFLFFASPFTSVFTSSPAMEVETEPVNSLAALFGASAFPVFTFFQAPVNEDAIIEEFLRDDPNQYGPPPASEESIKKLQEIKFCPEGNGDKCCPVCQEDYVKDETLTRLPCGHDYHGNCVTQWLNKHNSCPMCREKI